MVVTKVAEQVRVRASDLDSGGLGEVAQAAGRVRRHGPSWV
jgi:hypothetical protein